MQLNLPTFDVRLRTDDNGQQTIYDPLRRRYMRLTPEEWVRQHFCNYLVSHLGYPAMLLGNEVSLKVGGVTRRCDTVLYHPVGMRPRMIVEYKAPHIPLTEQVFTQIQSYNSVLRADYLIVSNGMQHYCCHMDYVQQMAQFLTEIPHYCQLV